MTAESTCEASSVEFLELGSLGGYCLLAGRGLKMREPRTPWLGWKGLPSSGEWAVVSNVQDT